MREGCFSDKQFKDRRWVKLGDNAKHNWGNPVLVESAPDFGGEQYCQNLPVLFMNAVKIMQSK